MKITSKIKNKHFCCRSVTIDFIFRCTIIFSLLLLTRCLIMHASPLYGWLLPPPLVEYSFYMKPAETQISNNMAFGESLVVAEESIYFYFPFRNRKRLADIHEPPRTQHPVGTRDG
jgi:hypothetical protein